VPRRQTYAALLRAINLGSRNKVSMAELRSLLEEIGAADVVTYVQSGNVVFTSAGNAADLTKAVEREIKRRLNLDITVLLRTKAQLMKLVTANPFGGTEPKTLYVTFLAETPPRARVRSLDPDVGGRDEFRVSGREVYLRFPNGYGRSKLTNAYFEKQLDVRATTRNWKTVTTVADLASR
jgi:uncharacterized protein (DUF1697 family)